MVQKTVREENEDCWDPRRWDPPAYSEGIDQIKRMYKSLTGTGSSSNVKGFSDEYARNQLSSINRIPKEIINDILGNIEHLDDECDRELYSAKLSRPEYNNVMKVVQRASLKFCQDGLADEKIRPWITKLVKGMLAERKQYGKINSKAWLLEWESRIGYGKKVSKVSAKPFRVPKKKIFSYSPGATKAVFGPKTVEEIQKKFCQISRDLENLPAIDPDSVEPFKKGLVQAVCDLAGIGVSLTDLEKNHNREVTNGKNN